MLNESVIYLRNSFYKDIIYTNVSYKFKSILICNFSESPFKYDSLNCGKEEPYSQVLPYRSSGPGMKWDDNSNDITQRLCLEVHENQVVPTRSIGTGNSGRGMFVMKDWTGEKSGQSYVCEDHTKNKSCIIALYFRLPITDISPTPPSESFRTKLSNVLESISFLCKGRLSWYSPVFDNNILRIFTVDLVKIALILIHKILRYKNLNNFRVLL